MERKKLEMFTEIELLLSQEKYQQIKPLLIRFGIQPDFIDGVESVRLDKLLSVLPDWCFMQFVSDIRYTLDKAGIHWELIERIVALVRPGSRGQAALKACAELIELLDGNGLLENKGEK
jgi:hypothetical protein